MGDWDVEFTDEFEIGGDKTGDDRWYEVYVAIADDLYDAHLKALTEERKREETR